MFCRNEQCHHTRLKTDHRPVPCAFPEAHRTVWLTWQCSAWQTQMSGGVPALVFVFCAHFIMGNHGASPWRQNPLSLLQSHLSFCLWPNHFFLLKHLLPADLIIGNHSNHGSTGACPGAPCFFLITSPNT